MHDGGQFRVLVMEGGFGLAGEAASVYHLSAFRIFLKSILNNVRPLYFARREFSPCMESPR